jgi:WD40 repeat protein
MFLRDLLSIMMIMASIFGSNDKSGGEPLSTMPAVRLTLHKELSRWRAEDLSDGGRYLLLSTCRKRVIVQTVPLDGSRVESDAKPEDSPCALQVFDLQEGHPVRTIGTTFFPSEVQWLSEPGWVLYKETVPGTREQERELRLWNYSSGETRAGWRERDTWFQQLTSLKDKMIVGRRWGKSKTAGQAGRESLALLNLKNGEIRDLGSLDPLNTPPGPSLSGGISTPPDREFFVYRTGGDRPSVYIWDSDPLRVRLRIDLTALSDGRTIVHAVKIVFTPDGKLVLVSGKFPQSTTPPQTGASLLFYDPNTGQLTKNLEISFLSSTESTQREAPALSFVANAMAVSHDGQMIAVGATRDERQGFVHVFDISTGAELARVSHPPIKPKRDDPFQAMISYICFTPDDKYLISSTYDTRVWEISRPRGK